MGSRGISSVSREREVLSVQNGNTEIQLGSPLVYDITPQRIGSEKLTKKVLNFENKYYKDQVEHNILLDWNGRVVEQNTGTEDEVEASESARERCDVLSHNHPSRDDALLGGTFSPSDLTNFLYYDYTMVRATASEGTYVMTKSSRYTYDKGGKFFYALTKMHERVEAKYEKQFNKMQSNYDTATAKIENDSTLTDSQKEAKIDKLTLQFIDKVVRNDNKKFVELHDWYRQNSEKYGMIYGLEHRRNVK